MLLLNIVMKKVFVNAFWNTCILPMLPSHLLCPSPFSVRRSSVPQSPFTSVSNGGSTTSCPQRQQSFEVWPSTKVPIFSVTQTRLHSSRTANRLHLSVKVCGSTPLSHWDSHELMQPSLENTICLEWLILFVGLDFTSARAPQNYHHSPLSRLLFLLFVVQARLELATLLQPSTYFKSTQRLQTSPNPTIHCLPHSFPLGSPF